MKKYLLSTLAVACVFCASASARAADDGLMTMNMTRGYAVMQAGFGMGHQKYKESGVFNVGAGYHLNRYLKSDLTVGVRAWGKIKDRGYKADLFTVPALVNVYAAVPYRGLEPYIMGGIGAAWTDADSTSVTKGDDRFSFAWQVGAGLGYRLSDCWSLDLGYRFADLGEARSKMKDGSGRIKKDIKSHDILLSARYYF